MFDADELVIGLTATCGGRDDFGRTTLQKLVYLTTAALGWQRAGHEAHYYGPFSRRLERTVARMTSEGWLVENSEDLGFMAYSGYQARKYKYALTSSGYDRALQLEQRQSGDMESIRQIVETILSRVGRLDQRVLSLAAKVHYIIEREGKPVSHETIIGQAHELGWKITAPDIARVLAILEDLNLVRVSR